RGGRPGLIARLNGGGPAEPRGAKGGSKRVAGPGRVDRLHVGRRDGLAEDPAARGSELENWHLGEALERDGERRSLGFRGEEHLRLEPREYVSHPRRTVGAEAGG